MHYFPFNIKDYASHTGHLSNIEDLAYRRLLEQYYLSEQPLNENVTVVARLIRMKDNEKEVGDVLNEFFTLTYDGWINHRASKEIELYHSKKEQASRAGKASAERRSNARSTEVQPTNNQEPITNNHKPKREKATSVACPPTVDQQVWNDWLIIRKAKSLPMTETAWGQIQNEFRKANLNDQDGVKYCCLSNWASFKFSWYEKQMQEQNSGLTKSAQAKQKVLSGLTRGLIGGSNVKLLG